MRFAVRRALLLAATLAIAALTIGPGFAADAWPTRPVRLIVTLGPGSGVDISARMFADKLSSMWHQPVVVENRPGGDGIVAITSFLGAHDDHTLLVSPVSSFTAHPYFHDTLPYDPKDMIPVARISSTEVAVAVPTSLQTRASSDLRSPCAERRSDALDDLSDVLAVVVALPVCVSLAVSRSTRSNSLDTRLRAKSRHRFADTPTPPSCTRAARCASRMLLPCWWWW